jgi:hypothetical protein
MTDREEPREAPYVGTYDAKSMSIQSGTLPGAIEFLEPWDPLEVNDPDATSILRVHLETHEPGWNFSADLTVPFCAGGYTCYCPCE